MKVPHGDLSTGAAGQRWMALLRKGGRTLEGVLPKFVDRHETNHGTKILSRNFSNGNWKEPPK